MTFNLPMNFKLPPLFEIDILSRLKDNTPIRIFELYTNIIRDKLDNDNLTEESFYVAVELQDKFRQLIKNLVIDNKVLVSENYIIKR